MRGQLRGIVAFLSFCFCAAAASAAAEFEQLGGEVLARLMNDPKTRLHRSLSFRDLEALPSVLRGTRSALLLAKTDQGNLARMLVTPGFRKRPGHAEPGKAGDEASRPELVPLLLVERFDVFEGTHPATRLAHGRDRMLFAGFQLDLDSGQVVPEGLGGDLSFSVAGRDDGRLEPVGPVLLGTLEAAPSLPQSAPGSVSSGTPAAPGDLNGRFRLVADGRWRGLLELLVGESGSLTGRFHSDLGGADHAVTGGVDPELPHKVRFTIQFPRAKQEYQGLLWAEGRQVISGTGSLLGKEFGFVAIRDGSRLDLDEEPGVEAAPPGAPRPGMPSWLHVGVEREADRYVVAGASCPAQELAEKLAAALRDEPRTGVVLTARDEVPWSRLRQAVDAVRRAGVTAIRLGAADDPP